MSWKKINTLFGSWIKGVKKFGCGAVKIVEGILMYTVSPPKKCIWTEIFIISLWQYNVLKSGEDKNQAFLAFSVCYIYKKEENKQLHKICSQKK